MSRFSVRSLRFAAAMALLLFACGKTEHDQPPHGPTDAQKLQLFLNEHFPLHGLVTGVQLSIRDKPDPEAQTIGWLRIGTRIRLGKDKKGSATCQSGWHPLYPQGWVCLGEGVSVSNTPPSSDIASNPPAKDAALPYRYYMVKDLGVPEYHRLPSRNEQRAALAYSKHYLELLGKDEKRAQRFLDGELKNEIERPSVVRRLLRHGFFLAAAGIETRAKRNFIRTVSGRYIKEAHLAERSGSDFHGEWINDENRLPIAWAIRGASPLKKHESKDGSIKLIKDESHDGIARLSKLDWKGLKNINGKVYHELGDELYLRNWYAAVAKKVKPPKGVKDSDTWIHIALNQQTLVLYHGKKPIYATLISTGVTDFETPTGEFHVRDKRVADTMANIGADLDNSYSIEDVPWTQYIKGSVAIHGAFWHNRFGLRNSHGCINLAPKDAHVVFNETKPELPEGWHGIHAPSIGEKGSLVWISD
ncbi:MAG: L,D-transpeptidase [Myxococcales bacterium]|nr:MAG: L,D-transpeptidase [Myxococcales bacterium]